MKHSYETPQTEVVVMRIEDVICGSPVNGTIGAPSYMDDGDLDLS